MAAESAGAGGADPSGGTPAMGPALDRALERVLAAAGEADRRAGLAEVGAPVATDARPSLLRTEIGEVARVVRIVKLRLFAMSRAAVCEFLRVTLGHVRALIVAFERTTDRYVNDPSRRRGGAGRAADHADRVLGALGLLAIALESVLRTLGCASPSTAA